MHGFRCVGNVGVTNDRVPTATFCPPLLLVCN